MKGGGEMESERDCASEPRHVKIWLLSVIKGSYSLFRLIHGGEGGRGRGFAGGRSKVSLLGS